MATILIIEDNTEIRENLVEIFELEGHSIITAENGKTGFLEAVKSRPDLIFCDLMMHQMNGYEVIKKLKREEATSGIPFIFLTARTEKQNIQEGMNLGADAYIQKPFDTKYLLAIITKVLSKNSSP